MTRPRHWLTTIISALLLAWLQLTAPLHALAEPPAAAEHGVVNINLASSAELERLPGIGPARARAILELRARLSRFTRLEQLLRVKGIGRATFRKLRAWLVLDGPTTLAASG